MTVEQVKEQVKKLTGKDITDGKAQALLNAHSGELSDRALDAVGGAWSDVSLWHHYRCWSGCPWFGWAPTLADAEKRHREQYPGCSGPGVVIEAHPPLPGWLANPSADDLERWTE